MINIGLRVFMAYMQIMVVVLRAVMEKLPAKDARDLSQFEEQAALLAYDADKLLLPEHIQLFSAFGWFIIIYCTLGPACDLIKIFWLN